MGREQHYVGLHYRTKFQIGATNATYGEDDYFDGSDQKFQFSHPRTSIKDELSPVQLPLKIQKQKNSPGIALIIQRMLYNAMPFILRIPLNTAGIVHAVKNIL